MLKIAMVANSLTKNGISSVIINYCTYLDHNRFQVTVLCGGEIEEGNRRLCEENGAKVIQLPEKHKNTKAYLKALRQELKKGKYDIIHVHCNSAMATSELLVARSCGIRGRIPHSHNTTCSHMKAHKLLYPIFTALYTDGLACGRDAGKWLFRDRPFTVIPNGFDQSRFVFDAEKREEYRKKLNIENKFVLGHIGRFNQQKNQEYLLKIFEKTAEKDPNAFLLLVGDGVDFEKIKSLADQSPYKERIHLYGKTDHPEYFYSVFDEFIFPSRYEGLPVTLLEAQINGLPCTISDMITDEVIINPNVKQVALNGPIDGWVAAIEENNKRVKIDLSKFASYNIEDDVRILEKVYSKYEK